ncbi:uncharacterized protein LOC122665450 [Telopea speciosissima]|uniref:uncharacterized protein LOC122665450 n=1 Tax=Telopea speciosissima TaxID=54955 RepID=UPI001CC74457|nr:uncharacterized protein LOC122665450 [Telopea speciosissima]
MTRDIVIRHHSLNQRNQPLLANQQSTKKKKLTFAEVAGGTAAECAAVCCCCPCGLVNLLVLAVYKLPAGLCKKALKNKNSKSFNNGLLPQRRKCNCECSETKTQVHPVSINSSPSDKPEQDDQTEKKVMELEKEMWDRFYSAGFWRSPSQRQ